MVLDRPLDADEVAEGFTVVCNDIPESRIAKFEWVEEGKPYREWLLPAAVANSFGRPSIHDDDFKGYSRRDVLKQCDDLRRCRRTEDADKVGRSSDFS